MNDVIAIKSGSVVYLFYAVSGVSDCVHSAVLCVKLYFWSHGGHLFCTWRLDVATLMNLDVIEY